VGMVSGKANVLLSAVADIAICYTSIAL